MAWMLPCPKADTACRSAEELVRLTHLRISCGRRAFNKSSAPGRQLDALVRHAPEDTGSLIVDSLEELFRVRIRVRTGPTSNRVDRATQ